MISPYKPYTRLDAKKGLLQTPLRTVDTNNMATGTARAGGFDFSKILITIPGIDGVFEAGIAIGIDNKLPDSKRLRVPRDRSPENASCYAATWAKKYCHDNNIIENDIRKVVIAGAYIAVRIGAIRSSADTHDADGDWLIDDPAIEYMAVDPDEVTYIDAQRALTIMIATKVNWWLTNHHTGQQTMSGFVRKVIKTHYGQMETHESLWMDIAHMMGHWISTKYILTRGGIDDILATEPHIDNVPAPLCLAPDVIKRLESLPAGTHRLALCHALASRLVKSPLLYLCPRIREFAGFPITANNIRGNRAHFHIGAKYLTGLDRYPFDDLEYEEMLGRLGSYIHNVAPRSTLAKSPHVTLDKITSYPDYDDSFASACKVYAVQAAKARNVNVDALFKYANVTEVGEADDVHLAYRSKLTDSQKKIITDIQALQLTSP